MLHITQTGPFYQMNLRMKILHPHIQLAITIDSGIFYDTAANLKLTLL